MATVVHVGQREGKRVGLAKLEWLARPRGRGKLGLRGRLGLVGGGAARARSRGETVGRAGYMSKGQRGGLAGLRREKDFSFFSKEI